MGFIKAMRLLAAGLALTVPLLSIGCANWSTFPPVEGRDSFSPGLAPAPDVMAKAIAYAHQRTGRGEPLVFNLPLDVSPGTWATVEIKLRAEGGVPMKPGDRMVWSIEQVRFRGNVAEVDVVHLEQGVYQLATVHLSCRPFEPFRADYLQRWLVPVEPPVANDPRLPKPPPTEAEPATEVDASPQAEFAAPGEPASPESIEVESPETTEPSSGPSAAPTLGPPAR